MMDLSVIRKVSLIGLGIALAVMGIHIFLLPLSDWMVRTSGAVALVGTAVVSYCSVRLNGRK